VDREVTGGERGAGAVEGAGRTAAGGDRGAATAGVRPLWRNRDFTLLWCGQTLSVLGTRTSAVAVPLLVLGTTGSVRKAGVAGFVATLPYLLFYLPAGALVDRWNRRRVMLWCDAGRAVVLGSVPLALWAGRLTYPHLLLAGFAGGTLYVFFSVAEKAALPALVPDRQLTAALAQEEAKSRGAALAGPPLGGLLYGVSHALPFAADALSYVVSFGALLGVRADLRVRRAAPAARMRTEIADALRWLRGQHFIRVTMVCVALVNLMFQALNLVLIVLAARLGASTATTGAVLGCFGLGGLAGALCAPWLARRVAPRTVAVGATWLWALLLAPMAAVSAPWALAAVATLLAFVGPVWNVVVSGYQYQVVPGHMLGRIKSVVLLVSWGAMPFGQLLGGFLLGLTGPRGAVVALLGLTLGVALLATLAPGVRRAGPALRAAGAAG
jgi:MFS family permease